MIQKITVLTVGLLFLIVSLGFADQATTVKKTTEVVYVTKEPPKAKIEKQPPQPSKTAVWINGRWNWNGQRFVWAPGHWDLKPKGTWVAGRWEKHKRGFVWVDGHWKANKARKISKSFAEYRKNNDWVAGQWKKTRKGRVWVSGHYR